MRYDHARSVLDLLPAIGRRLTAGALLWAQDPSAAACRHAPPASGVRPARVKGTGMINPVKTLRRLRAAAEPRLPAHLEPYLGGRILLSSWYPESDLRGLLGVLVEVLDPPDRDPWEWLGAFAAHSDLTGTYSILLSPGRPATTLGRFPRLWGLYHDTGTVTIDRLVPGRARVRLDGFPLVDDELCRRQAGYLEKLLELAGAADVEVRVCECAPSQDRAAWHLTWREDAALRRDWRRSPFD